MNKYIYNFHIIYSWGVKVVETHTMTSAEAEEYCDYLIGEGHEVHTTTKFEK